MITNTWIFFRETLIVLMSCIFYATFSLAMETTDNSAIPNKDFIRHKDHSQALGQKERIGLVKNGYKILQEILDGKDLKQIDNNNTYFSEKLNKTWLVGTQSFINLAKGGKSEEEKELTHQRQKALESIICVTWALADYATKINQPFTSGSFSIIDPHEYLLNFFESYLYFLKTDHSMELEDLPIGLTNAGNLFGSSFMYGRDPDKWSSSHYSKTSIIQFGIDACLERNDRAHHYFPYYTDHILIGRVWSLSGNEKTFIKFEGHGTANVRDWLYHSIEFLIDHRTGKRSEKEISKELLRLFTEIAIKASPYLSQKLPPSPPLIRRMLNHNNKFKDIDTLLLISNKKSYDLACLYQYAKYIQLSLKQKNCDIVVNNFINKLQELYSDNDKVLYRTGNEVVIALNEVVPKGSQFADNPCICLCSCCIRNNEHQKSPELEDNYPKKVVAKSDLQL